MEPRARISPVLVGRDDLLELGHRRAAAVSEGRGHVLLLAGEAGIGKSRLLGAIIREAQRLGLNAGGAAAFPRDLEMSGGLLLDLGDQLSRSKHPAWADRGRRLLERMANPDQATGGDRHRRRRLLVLDVVELVAGLTEEGPLALGLEDLHWTDDLTLEVIAQLARRAPDLPLLLVATYRSDELYPRVPMRQWRSRLIGQRLAEDARLSRLDQSQTASMAHLILGGDGTPSGRLVEALHRRSDGIPLHVEELLAATDDADAAATLPSWELPDTLSEAILQRAAQLSSSARRVAATAAVIGRSFDLDLICAVHAGRPEAVGRALDEL